VPVKTRCHARVVWIQVVPVSGEPPRTVPVSLTWNCAAVRRLKQIRGAQTRKR